MIAIVVKCLNFHFSKKEYQFVYATAQFDLNFKTWHSNNPGVIYHNCRIKFLKLLDLNALNILCNQ